ncbi:MAG: beta-glucosidase, partial [Bacteroidota bacterium]|nr:beta-glucosidase [Bacteroidota bacterium]
MKHFTWILLITCTFLACRQEETEQPVNAYIESVTLNGKALSASTVYDMPNDSVVLSICFSSAIQLNQWNPDKLSLSSFTDPTIRLLESPDKQTLRLSLNTQLQDFTKYRLSLYSGKNLGLNLINSYDWLFVTALDSTPKFPVISDDSLLTLVQRRTFDYFWTYGHPVSGLARERLGSGETVTTGGSGFGLMAILTGIERGFITRAEGFTRLDTIVSFLSRSSTDTFHGAFPHWMNGTTGKAIAFSTKDDGADLIETAFL